MRDLFRFLRGVPFFRDLTEDEIRKIQEACHSTRCGPGEVIFEEGSPGNRFYLVTEGAVEVWKDFRDPDKSLLAVHGPGHVFGEMALIEDLPRSATVVAREPTLLFYIPREDFNRIVMENGRIALSIMRSVSSLVRESTNSFVDSLRQRNRELEEINRELRETQEELLRAERLSTLGKFSSVIIHDIRNPLSVLRTLAEMIQLNSDDPRKLERNAQRMVHEVDQLNRMVGEILDYARGEIRLNMSIVDLARLTEKLVEAMAEKFRARRIEVETEVGFTGPVILDEPRLLRVLLNLADNAWKAMPEGGTFTLTVSRGDRSLLIEVRDTGVGMSPEVQKRIFEPFYSCSKEGGTGLGMSIVQSIIHAHRGTLTVRSRRGGGTVFRIDLPLIGG